MNKQYVEGFKNVKKAYMMMGNSEIFIVMLTFSGMAGEKRLYCPKKRGKSR